ncbi:ureidoglycolate hydrolase [Aspergillus clavatus NRRL 1]|uniref:Ureidoglycolate hydrolase, putative n=1 Tax=Aspergillus clavatus (strain ATCC 1007 / CBS 513.65 / DSM 816 / NCTC 3887 / NRRL 1 / QM 1276 / 107) TaxID=344612 RepID=A1C418_ASPCL|nr:ureidoglycolate hydrolase, putative [Aspergillus clavatus NRRL 1]EAW15158.1 ureidoglycolate hydrolase, putative [Aspergillus clavatus NRRL 1]
MAPTLTSHPTLRIIPEPLTPEAFAPFGTAIRCPLPRDLASAPSIASLPPHDPTPVVANQSSALKYSPISPLLDRYPGQCPSGRPSAARMSMFSCFPRKLRSAPSPGSKDSETSSVFDVRILERHPFTTQTFTPLDLSSQTRVADADEPYYLVVVAPTLKGQTATAETPAGTVTIRDPPDLENVKAFVARGGQAVTYGVGTWHAPMVVLGSRRVDFVVVQFANGVDDEDVQEAAFGEGIVVELGKGGAQRRAGGGSKL